MAAPTTSQTPKVKYCELRRTFNPWSRKFGRQDVKQYYDLSEDVSIGRSEIEGVSVDCRFVFSKSRLGKLNELDGGIIYMNLAIEQPADWRLREASISVILEDAPTSDQRRSTRPRHPRESVGILGEYYGPKLLVGPKTIGESTKDYNIGPQFEGAGFGASLGEFGNSVTQPRTSWWSFYGTPKTVNVSSGQYTTLKWVMSQDALAYTTEHPAKIQTAFSFTHKYQPFILRVEIDGKLRHLHRKFKDKTIGLFTKAKRETSIVLLFEFDLKDYFGTPLLEHAKGLESEMAELACQTKHIEVTPRIPSPEYFAQQSASRSDQPDSNRQTPSKVAEEVSQTPGTRLDQDDLTVRLQRAHTALLSTGSLGPRQGFPPALSKDETENAAYVSPPVNELSHEEVAEALQQMPTLAWWMILVLLRVMRALPITSTKHPGNKST